MNTPRIALPLAWFVMTLGAPASGAVLAVAPFVGDVSDTFDQYSAVNAVQQLSVFSGAGVIRNLSAGGAIKLEFASQFNGDLVVPISGMMMGQLGIADWQFAAPVVRFGGYWENNSGASDATVSFFDAADHLLSSVVASVPFNGQHWVWNGWESEVPFVRVHVVGNGVINGFIWYENVQLTVLPEPSGAGAALAGGGMFFVGRRRRRRR
jgi:hypothetical protein